MQKKKNLNVLRISENDTAMNRTPNFMHFIIIFLTGIMLNSACKKEDNSEEPKPVVDYRTFNSASDFFTVLNNVVTLTDSAERISRTNALWDSLKENKQIPLIIGDSVVFLYRSSASTVSWAGDFNGWNPATAGWQGTKAGQSNIWFLKKSFPMDARLDYKIVANTNWILDPANPNQQYSGFGPNSELRMPDWQFPDETKLIAGAGRGSLSENQIITSAAANLGYQVRYKVYTPFNYSQLENLPVIYVTDGHEYADDRLGAMIIVLDNLIHQNRIEPVIAVFIDPRDPVSGANRRMTEYRANIRFANFVADELTAKIDSDYKTNADAVKRAILGTSLGGWNSAFFGLMRSDKFQLIGIHSPAFDNAILQNFSNSALLPLKIYMSTGVIFDTQTQARNMKTILEAKGYPLQYKEVNEGHSWGNWRALIDEPLIWFFGK
ncbi:MAG: hypothetical protein KG029_07385 [Bacteroidetes bacterium]|nr:hypothetical protein [Bacteroidota bacterium]